MNQARACWSWRTISNAILLILLTCLFCVLPFSSSAVYPTKLGDLDGDGQITVFDLSIIIGHINGSFRLSNEMAVFADVNQDGVVNDVDLEMVVDAILGLREFPVLPLTRILETSPA